MDTNDRDRKIILKRLRYLASHPDEETFDVREGWDGEYDTWTNSCFLRKELQNIRIIEELDETDKKLDQVAIYVGLVQAFVRAYDAWVKDPGNIHLAEEVKKARGKF